MSFNDISTTLGRQFVKVYYQTLYSKPRTLYQLYNPEAIRTKASLQKDEHSESWVGIKEIKESFEKKGSAYKNVQIISANFQPSFAGSILVTVSGTLMEDEDTALESINFVQVFLLVPAGQSWAIQNDVLRFDAHHQKEENVENSQETERSAEIQEIEEKAATTESEEIPVKEEKEEPAAEEKNEEEAKELEIPAQPSTESTENKEENAQESANPTNNEKEAPVENQTEKSEEKAAESKQEEEKPQKTQQNQTQTTPQPETEQREAPQNKKPKFNKKYESGKGSPKSKNWNRQNAQQNNKTSGSAGTGSSTAPSSAPTTPSYADIAKKIAAAGSLNPPSTPVVASTPAPAAAPAAVTDASNPPENQSPASEPVTHKEQAKTQQVKREYKDSPTPFRKDPPASGINKTIVARHLPATASKENLKTLFEEFGNVLNVHIVSNSPLAFIEFSDPSSAQAVLLRVKTSPILVDGKEIKVEPKKAKRAGGPVGGQGGSGGKGNGGGNVNNNNSNRKKEYRVRGNNNESSSNRGNN